MSEDNTTAAKVESTQKESKVSMMMIIMLVILIWAVVAYFMTMGPDKKDQNHQQMATTEQAPKGAAPSPEKAEAQQVPAAVEATEKAAATAVVEAENTPAANENEAVQTLMEVFAPSGK